MNWGPNISVSGYPPQPQLSVSSSVILPTNTVQLTCTTASMFDKCYFTTVENEENTQPSPSCQLSLTWGQIKAWGHVNPPFVLHLKCFYTVKHSVAAPSDHSSSVSVFILGKYREARDFLLQIHSLSDTSWLYSCVNSRFR